MKNELSVVIPGFIADKGPKHASRPGLVGERTRNLVVPLPGALNLLLKDVAAVFGQGFSRMGSIEDFFSSSTSGT